MKLQTALVQFDPAPGDPNAPSVTPLYASATFRQPTAIEAGRFDYARSGNPTRQVLERQLARIEGGSHAMAFTSGMAAIDTALSLVSAGGAVIACQDLYGGAYRYLHQLAPRRGIHVRCIDTTDHQALEACLIETVSAGFGPVLVWVETPSNPLMRITDLRRTADLAHAHGARLAVDSSMMSPYLQRPLEAGADLVAHSGTKFLSGHAHVTAGALVTRDVTFGERLAWHQNAVGAALSPFDCWLLLGGLKTLALRLDRQQATAQRLAETLSMRSEVDTVCYPGLPTHPGAGVHRAQADGAGAVMGVRLATPALGRALVDNTELFQIAVSFGSVSSTIELPGRMSHAPMVGTGNGHDDRMVRLSIGIEDACDLESDLIAALERISVQA